MSLIVPIMVNSKVIGELTITRQQQLEKGRKEYDYLWDYRMAAPPHGGDPITMGGHITHNYYHPVSELLLKAFAAITARDTNE